MRSAQPVVASDELAQHYADPPDGIRVNMIMSVDGATAFDGLAGPLSGPCDQDLLVTLRGSADVVLVGQQRRGPSATGRCG